MMMTTHGYESITKPRPIPSKLLTYKCLLFLFFSCDPYFSRCFVLGFSSPQIHCLSYFSASSFSILLCSSLIRSPYLYSWGNWLPQIPPIIWFVFSLVAYFSSSVRISPSIHLHSLINLTSFFLLFALPISPYLFTSSS